MCSLCEKLHEINPEISLNLHRQQIIPKHKAEQKKTDIQKVYKDMHQWWIVDAQCVMPPENEEVTAFIQG